MAASLPAELQLLLDKQALYDAMLKNAFGSLAARLNDVLSTPTGTVVERIEMALEAWVDAVARRVL